jgi:hypothetical protein
VEYWLIFHFQVKESWYWKHCFFAGVIDAGNKIIFGDADNGKQCFGGVSLTPVNSFLAILLTLGIYFMLSGYF